jgi:hypothetical protein
MATQAVGRGARWRRKFWHWCRRYLPAEIAGTVCALVTTTVIYGMLSDRAVAAIAGTVSENLGFYGTLAIIEWRRQHSLGHGVWRTAARTFRLLLAEFGLIEALDSTVLRPMFMYLGPGITGGIGTGILLGKVMADVAFYAVAITSYELIRRRASHTGTALVGAADDAAGRSAA